MTAMFFCRTSGRTGAAVLPVSGWSHPASRFGARLFDSVRTAPL